MKVKERCFSYAQMHLKLHNTVNEVGFFCSGLAVKYFSDQLEQVSILVSDFHPAWLLLTATRAEIYFHSKLIQWLTTKISNQVGHR